MRLVIAAIGRLKDRGETDIVARYAERIDAQGRSVALGPLTIDELTESRAGDAKQRRDDEAARLLNSAAAADYLIALDERGRALSSRAFAGELVRIRDSGARAASFLIGGADGHGEVALRAARSTLSLGPMTLPHGLARAVLLEQIYRAITIVAGHPYHRD
ncbi:MAG: 23S rRNA (pseudouridine(1915)-N(3))-methyltransferase RlmH [Hyphomicrobiaceae bacterium]